METAARVIQMQVNTKRLVQHHRFSFGNSDTFLSEALQNARRSGATRIEITQDPREDVDDLVIEDNGTGISDFQKLIHVAESGWDPETVARESPYGLGFLSCLFAAEHITVESRGIRLSANTADILDFQPVSLWTTTERPGTRVMLKGIRLEPDHIDGSLRRLVRGFPVEVTWNGEALERPDAVNNGKAFITTSVGEIHVVGLDSGMDEHDPYARFGRHGGDRDCVLYLQGLPVSDGDRRGNIVHLDPTRFFGKLPDRDRLIDGHTAVQQVDAAVAEIWRARLEQFRAQFSAEEFVDRCWSTLHYWRCADLLNALDILPKQATEQVDEYPLLVATEWSHPYRSPGKGHLRRQDIEQGRERIFSLGEFEEGRAQAHQYAWLTGMTLLNESSLDADHWVHELAPAFDPDDIRTVIPKPLAEATYDGNWVQNVDVVLVPWYELDGPLGTVRATKDAMALDGFLSVGSRNVAFDDRTIVVPEGDKSGEVVRQLTDFVSDDNWDETAETEEKEHFGRFVRSMRPEAGAELIRDLLEDTDLRSYPGMASRRFTVTIDRRGRVQVKENRKTKA